MEYVEGESLGARLEREGIRVIEARDQDYSLEDVFLLVVEKSQREQRRAVAA